MCTLAQAQTYSSTDAKPSANLTVGERADIFLARRDYQQAIDLLKDAVHDKHADASIYNRLGIAYQETSNLGQAEKNYKNALKRDKHNATYLNNLGTVYYMRRKYKDATKEFTEAIQIDAAKAPYFVNLGGAEFAQKHFQPALAAYRQALRLDPDSLFPTTGASPVVQDITGQDTPRFHYDLSRLFCSMGMLDDAVHQFRQAYEQHYSGIRQSLTDPEFAPLRARPEYQALMMPKKN
ncbi:MAG TPA: tetratricopeptide repeat protein [Terriglobales bacterium]|nr:tetratricopeptide repeat protein [Terriglobales bacterium]